MKRLNVLYLSVPTVLQQWEQDVFDAIGDRHNLRVFDPDAPVAPQFDGIDVVVDMGGNNRTHEMYDAATSARLWQILSTGLDHVDVAYMKTKKFAISNCPGSLSAIGLADCAMMFILMLARGFHEASRTLREGGLYRPVGMDLEGKVITIVGFGSSGRQLARRAAAFGMRIQAVEILPLDAATLEDYRVELAGGPDELDDMLPRCDFLSLHLHLTAETRHFIDRRRLGLLKPTACLINVARGALVDQDALFSALQDGRLGGAGLDVFEREPVDPTLAVFELPNVVATPHIAGVTDGTSRNRAAAAAENIDRIARGLEPLYRVDLESPR